MRNDPRLELHLVGELLGWDDVLFKRRVELEQEVAVPPRLGITKNSNISCPHNSPPGVPVFSSIDMPLMTRNKPSEYSTSCFLCCRRPLLPAQHHFTKARYGQLGLVPGRIFKSRPTMVHHSNTRKGLGGSPGHPLEHWVVQWQLNRCFAFQVRLERPELPGPRAHRLLHRFVGFALS